MNYQSKETLSSPEQVSVILLSYDFLGKIQFPKLFSFLVPSQLSEQYLDFHFIELKVEQL